jgi:hypothetical protein
LAAAYMRPNEFIMRFEQFSETQIKFIKFALFGGVVFTWGILLNFFTVEVLQTDN